MDGIQFVVDSEGKKTAVIIDLERYGELLEDFFDVVVCRERASEEDIPWEEVEREIDADLEREVGSGAVQRHGEFARSS